jgi:hydrogenase maturation factor
MENSTTPNETLPELGKIHPAFFDKVIYPRLGKKDPNIIIGPKHGVDFGVLKIQDTYMSFSTDPFFIVPAYGFRRAAWFAFHIVMSDVAVSGLKPKYLTVDLNLPPEIDEKQLEELWDEVHSEANKYGVSIITGHTARYTGCNYPMVGGATSIAIGTEKELRGPDKVKKGDLIVITKGPAIETTGLLAVSFPKHFEDTFGIDFQRQAEAVFAQMSVMDDCAIAREFQGVHVMHDATECGIWGGLYEMAQAGNYGLKINQDAIITQEVIMKTCEHFKIDPFTSISEGTLLAIVDPKEADQLVKAFAKKDILASIAGEVTSPTEGIKVIHKGISRTLEHPKVDPFWIVMDQLSKENA